MVHWDQRPLPLKVAFMDGDKYALKDILMLCQLSWTLVLSYLQGFSSHQAWALGQDFTVAGMALPCGTGLKPSPNRSAFTQWEHLAWNVGLVIHKI